MRGSGVEGLIIFLGFIFSPTGIFRPYIEFRETHKSSLSFLDVHLEAFRVVALKERGCAYGGFN